MESSSSSSPEPSPGAAARAEYVGFWKRAVAFLIDMFIVTVVVVPLALAVYGMQYFDEQHAGGRLFDWAVNIALVIATIVFWRYRGATPGKMAISAKIVDAKTLGAPSTGALVVRYFAYLVSMLPLMIGFLWIGIDRRKQGFHDKIAGTVVIYDDED